MTIRNALEVLAVAVCVVSCRPAKGPCDDEPCRLPGQLCAVEKDKAVCACDAASWQTAPDGSCVPIVQTVTNPPDTVVDWAAPAAAYAAVVRVRDGENAPLAATVDLGNLRYQVPDGGVLSIDGLDAKTSVQARISAPGFVPVVRTLSVATAGYRALEVQLERPHVVRDFDGASSITIDDGPASVSFFAASYVDGRGDPYDGTVRANVTVFDTTSSRFDPRVNAPAPATARTRGGKTVSLEGAPVLVVSLSKPDGAPLELDPRREATVSFTLPEGVSVTPGQRLPLFHLDEARGEWVEDGASTVGMVPPALRSDGRSASCSGVVNHFSAYTVAPWAELDFGCVSLRYDVTLPAAFKLHHVETVTEQCSRPKAHGACGPVGSIGGPRWRTDGIFPAMQVVPVKDNQPVGLCQAGSLLPANEYTAIVFAEGPTPGSIISGPVPWAYELRLRTTVWAEVRGATVAIAQVYSPLRLESLARLPPGTNARTFTSQQLMDRCLRVDPTKTCNDVQVKIEIAADGQTIATVNGARDDDRDGYPGLSGQVSLPGLVADCNDADPTVFPFAREIPCNGKDDRCAGIADTTAVGPADFASPSEWNRQCKTLACATKTAEVPGNLVDENCDGFATDMDRDLYKALGDPATPSGIVPGDCDDTSALVSPRAMEAPGNLVDENCDGYAIDMDNDGHRLALSAATTSPLPADDCNDRNPLAFRSAVGNESSLRSYFVDGGTGVTRQADFCTLFDAQGRPTRFARENFFVDYDCNGFASDLDGDGWTVPGDVSKGVDKAYDCNDLDPRVVPIATRADRLATCTDAASQGANESTCMVDLSRFGGADRYVCPNAPHGGSNTCADVVDENDVSWGVFACNPQDWGLGDPFLPGSEGRLWGACDFGVKLPPCEVGTQCAGRRGAFSRAYLQRLAAVGITLDANGWHGLCLPSCGDRCQPNRCPDTTPTCTMQGRMAVCQ